MANSILTPTMITREALRILHGKLSFLGAVNKQYDGQFAKDGAKIGTQLNIRMPSRYTVRTGASLSANDHVERSTPLVVSSEIGVDVSFTTAELTMSLDDFGGRILDPAMAQLAAYLENDCLSNAYKLVNNYVGTTSTQLTLKTMQQAGQFMTETLTPYGDRFALLNPNSRVEVGDNIKSLFQESAGIAKSYRDGVIGRTAGFEVSENVFIPAHTRGSLAGSCLTTGTTLGTSTTANSWVSQTDLSVTGMTSATTLKAGDIITLSGVYSVNPESKANSGRLMRFVVQADVTLTTQANNYAVTVKPAMIYGTGNAFKNCVLSGVSDSSGLTVTAFGVASTAYFQDLFFHKDSFVFGTADLVDVTEFGAWGARDSMDGISMRIAKQYAIATDTVPCRIDILYGFAGLYPQTACRAFSAVQ